MRLLVLVVLFHAGCFASRGSQEPAPGVCCEGECTEGNICGISSCAAYPQLTCVSLDVVAGECGPLFRGCDEPGDCSPGDVCRADDSWTYYCRPPASCETSDAVWGPSECAYACRDDEDCPAGAPRCRFHRGDVGACADYGLCTSG